MASSSTDPTSDTGTSKHAWSQIVRSKHATSPSKKPSPQPGADQIQTLGREPQTNLARDQAQTMAEAGISASESTLDNDFNTVADARALDETSSREEETVETSKTAIDGNAVTAEAAEFSHSKSPDTSHGDVGDARVSRPPWRKPPVTTEVDVNPQPVMGATAWPALAEARNVKKNSEIRKSKASPVKAPQIATSISTQESPSKVSFHSGDVLNHQQMLKNKPSFKGAPVGIGRPAFQPIENGASFSEHPGLGAHGPSEQPLKHNTQARMKGNFSANPSMDTDRVYHHRNDGTTPFHNNNRKWRNNHRDQGRGWHHYGRVYENAGDMVLLLHEQRIGPRNMPRPQPYMNMNPGFYPVPHFQNNGMYYITPGTSEFVQGPSYYPMGHPGGVMAPNPFPLQSMLIKQVDYYFSVENLCRDVFLRTHMDEEGFVPVALIAQFNRIRSLSSNLLVILDALQRSSVVEVQHDKVRRRNDRGKWRLMQDQAHAVNSMQKNSSVDKAFQGKADRFQDVALVSLEDTKRSSALERAAYTGAEHAQVSCDGLNGRSDCNEVEDKGGLHNVDDNNLAPTSTSMHAFCRDGSKEGNAIPSTSIDDLAGRQSFESAALQEDTLCNHIALVTVNQETRPSHSRFLEESGRVPQAIVDGKPVSWSNPEAFWLPNSAYLAHGGHEQNDMQVRDSDYLSKPHKDGKEQPEDNSNRDLDRPVQVSHTSLGSYIAVP